MVIYSHSRLQTFEKCPQQFKFRYLDKIEVIEEGIEAFLGSRVHDTLEKLYRDLDEGRQNSLEELLAFYQARWEECWHEHIRIVRKDQTAADYRNIGISCLSNFYRRYAPFDDGRTIGLEKEIRVSLLDGKYLLRGFIDRLVEQEDGTIEIHDYKTSKRAPKQYYLDQDRQLALYQLGVEALWPEVKQVALVWHYLAVDVELRSRRTPAMLEILKRETARLIDKIERATVFNPRKSALCSWCLYQRLCPLMKNG